MFTASTYFQIAPAWQFLHVPRHGGVEVLNLSADAQVQHRQLNKHHTHSCRHRKQHTESFDRIGYPLALAITSRLVLRCLDQDEHVGALCRGWTTSRYIST